MSDHGAHDDSDSAPVRSLSGGRDHHGPVCHPSARVYGERKRPFGGGRFGARGSNVATVGRDRATIREFIRNQEPEDRRQDPMALWR